MKIANNLMMTGIISQIMNSISPKDQFEKDIQAEASFNYAKLLFESAGYPLLAMSRMLSEFKSNHPESRHAEEVKRMIASIYNHK